MPFSFAAVGSVLLNILVVALPLARWPESVSREIMSEAGTEQVGCESRGRLERRIGWNPNLRRSLRLKASFE